jgi:hypothetical protein
MSSGELIESIRGLCVALKRPLGPDEIACGWTEDKRRSVLGYFENLETKLAAGKAVPYIPFVRTLDAVGISEGNLFEEMCRITNVINSGSKRGQ